LSKNAIEMPILVVPLMIKYVGGLMVGNGASHASIG
jgi:hypothetical protein